jgi:hypothetical protein
MVKWLLCDGGRLYNPWSVGNALATGNLRSYWVESGNKFSYPFFFAMEKLIPSPGYDRIIQKRIYHFLDTDDRFRAQIADLLANNSIEIEIEEDMSYHSFVTYIPYVLLHEC